MGEIISSREVIREHNKQILHLLSVRADLLEALQGLVNDVKNKPNDTRYATHLKIAEAAIKKATE